MRFSTDMISISDWLEGLKAERTGRTLVTLDGPCASGKTTLAAEMGRIIGAPVLHSDDFVVPHARKTPERLAIPGGNCDWERLTAETLIPWKRGEPAFARRYNFREDRYEEPEQLPETTFLILEGSYVNLPAIRTLADVRCYLDTPEEIRMERLIRRESPASLAMFQSRWIPLEQAYYSAYQLPDEGCVILNNDSVMKEGGKET